MAEAAGKKRIQITRRDAVIGGTFALASGFAYARTPQVYAPVVDPEEFESWVPANVGRWREIGASGVILPPPDETRDRLYDSVVTRTYAAPGLEPVMLLLAYNNMQDGVLQVHRPEICYSVGGHEITDTQETRMTLGQRVVPANRFTAIGPQGAEEVEYFTRLGNAFPTSWAQQRLAVMRANIAGDIPDGMMMRVSQLGTDRDKKRLVMGEFANEFFNRTPEPLRRLLVGTTA
ncbi:MAG: exosortase-associated protein EpsI, V-type [Erythrobacter sp.]|jgi:EpsI family protein|nr:exosortase-associated protein EpsI, V-type [Erythrobacter sp.]